MDRVRRVFSGTADLREAGDWRNELEKDALFRTVAGRQFLDLLGDWLRAQLPDWEQNMRKLMMLREQLRQSSAFSQSERLRLIRQWIMQSLADQIQTNALKKLQEIEDELQPKTVKT